MLFFACAEGLSIAVDIIRLVLWGPYITGNLLQIPATLGMFYLVLTIFGVIVKCVDACLCVSWLFTSLCCRVRAREMCWFVPLTPPSSSRPSSHSWFDESCSCGRVTRTARRRSSAVSSIGSFLTSASASLCHSKNAPPIPHCCLRWGLSSPRMFSPSHWLAWHSAARHGARDRRNTFVDGGGTGCFGHQACTQALAPRFRGVCV